jgi:hypothetical protein
MCDLAMSTMRRPAPSITVAPQEKTKGGGIFNPIRSVTKISKTISRNLTILKLLIYKVRINYRRILQNHIFTNTEQKYMILQLGPCIFL